MAQHPQRRVGRMVALLVKVSGKSLTEVARELSIHRNSLGDKIAGRRPFLEDEILGLAEIFEVEPGRLFDDPLELLGVAHLRTPGPVTMGYSFWAGQRAA